MHIEIRLPERKARKVILKPSLRSVTSRFNVLKRKVKSASTAFKSAK